MRSKRTWLNGAPPHVGWWNSSVMRQEDSWRWWDGRVWSLAATSKEPLSVATRRALQPVPYKDGGTSSVEWTDYYPENARVPRVAP